MLFETLKQSYIFLGCLYFGLIAGILKEVSVFVINLLLLIMHIIYLLSIPLVVFGNKSGCFNALIKNLFIILYLSSVFIS